MSKMSGREIDQLDKWFDDHEEFLIPAPDKADQVDPPYKYLWDRDYNEVKAKLMELDMKEPGEHCYTLVEADGDGFVLSGWHFVNRIGYFISTQPIDIESVDLCLRYW